MDYVIGHDATLRACAWLAKEEEEEAAKPIPAVDFADVGPEWFDLILAEEDARKFWERDASGLISGGLIDTGCGKLPPIHPRSYAARFAKMQREHERRVDEYELARYAGAWQPAASTYGADHSEVSKSKAHPRSAYAHLPLRGCGAGNLKPTKEDKATWAARPLKYTKAA